MEMERRREVLGYEDIRLDTHNACLILNITTVPS